MEGQYSELEISLIKGFAETAKQDLSSYHVLHSVGNYNHSIFHLQQFVEKFSKSFGILNKTITITDIKKDISHKTGKIFTRNLSNYQSQIDQLKEIGKQNPDFLKFTYEDNQVDLSDYVNTYRKKTNSLFHLDSDELFQIESDEIESLINRFNEILQIKIELRNLDYSNFKEGLLVIFNKYEKFLGQNFTVEKEEIENPEKLKEIIEYTIRSTEIDIDIKHIAINLFFFSKILERHYEDSRYPCLCCGMLPSEKYSKELGLINQHKLICDNMTVLLNTYEYYINQIM